MRDHEASGDGKERTVMLEMGLSAKRQVMGREGGQRSLWEKIGVWALPWRHWEADSSGY